MCEREREGVGSDCRRVELCLASSSSSFLFVKGKTHVVLARRTPCLSLSLSLSQAWAAGCGDHGRLGTGAEKPRRVFSPVEIREGEQVLECVAIAAGGAHSVFVTG